VKKELHKDMEILKKRKKSPETLEIKRSLSKIKNTLESRISGLKDKIDIKEKKQRIFSKRTEEL
jgi:hypothetical protein